MPKSSGLFVVASESGQATFGRTSVTRYSSTESSDIRISTLAPIWTFHSGLKRWFTAWAKMYEFVLRPGWLPPLRM